MPAGPAVPRSQIVSIRGDFERFWSGRDKEKINFWK